MKQIKKIARFLLTLSAVSILTEFVTLITIVIIHGDNKIAKWHLWWLGITLLTALVSFIYAHVIHSNYAKNAYKDLCKYINNGFLY